VEGVAAVYVGHTPVQEVTKLGNVVYIDTGAVWTSKLTLIQI
jgi:serine/threonine protein phosphatase 1